MFSDYADGLKDAEFEAWRPQFQIRKLLPLIARDCGLPTQGGINHLPSPAIIDRIDCGFHPSLAETIKVYEAPPGSPSVEGEESQLVGAGAV